MFVHVGKSLEGLEHNVSNHLLREKFAAFAHQLVHIQVQVLEDEVQSVLLQTHFVQAHDVRMGQLQQ